MMSKSKPEPIISLSFLGSVLLLLCLFAPSAWMIVNIPPLWRDADAYNQVVQPPLTATYWGHGAAYCYLAKLPLFLGEQLERRWMGTPPAAPSDASITLTTITDTGVWLLIIAQHLALCGATFLLIAAVVQVFWIRLVLALIWASNPLFYTFAH